MCFFFKFWEFCFLLFSLGHLLILGWWGWYTPCLLVWALWSNWERILPFVLLWILLLLGQKTETAIMLESRAYIPHVFCMWCPWCMCFLGHQTPVLLCLVGPMGFCQNWTPLQGRHMQRVCCCTEIYIAGLKLVLLVGVVHTTIKGETVCVRCTVQRWSVFWTFGLLFLRCWLDAVVAQQIVCLYRSRPG